MSRRKRISKRGGGEGRERGRKDINRFFVLYQVVLANQKSLCRDNNILSFQRCRTKVIHDKCKTDPGYRE